MTTRKLPTGPAGDKPETASPGTQLELPGTPQVPTPPKTTTPTAAPTASKTASKTAAKTAPEPAVAGVDPVAELAGAWAANAADPLAAAPIPGVSDPASAAGLPIQTGPDSREALSEDWREDWDPQHSDPDREGETGSQPDPGTTPGGRRRRPGGGVRVSDVDLDWLTWLGRFRYATTVQLEQKFKVSDRAVRGRLMRLEQMGLLVRYAWINNVSIALPTLEGMRAAGLDLPAPEFKHGTVPHELAVVSLGMLWEAHGLSVVTDREIRATLSPHRPLTDELVDAADIAGLDPTGRPLFAVFQGAGGQATQARALLRQAVTDPAAAKALGKGMALGAGSGRQTRIAWHTPDLVVARAPKAKRSQTVAVEVELHAKQGADYRRILSAYADPSCGGGRAASETGGYSEVRYYVGTPALRDVIANVANGLGLSSLVSVQLLSEIELPAAPPDLIRQPRHNSSVTLQRERRAAAAQARALQRTAGE